MAVYLKRKHHLLALKTSLGREGREWMVQLELETHAGPAPETLASFRLSTQALGLPRYFEAESSPVFTIPPEITAELSTQIKKLQLEPSHPLWLHLVKPYGYLGIVPWEDLLVPALQRPVLRLPDFLEPARERRDTLDVAICCSVPLSEPSFSIPQVLGDVAAAILSGSPRLRTQIHVFPDLDSFEPLHATFANEPRVSVHDPSEAARYLQAQDANATPDAARTVTSPWLQWMRDAMQGKSLDTVHFVCHGYFSDERASLTVTECPATSQNRRTARFLSVAETAAFLNQTGAWSLVCTAPPNNYSDAGLRYFVDTLAQVRPGPALFHDLKRDPGLMALRNAYGFLFALMPREAVAGPIFMYCQPALVDTQIPTPVADQSTAGIVSLNAELFSMAAPAVDEPPAPQAKGPGRKSAAKRAGKTPAPAPAPAPAAPDVSAAVPNWLASAQRYVEEQVQEAQRRDATSSRTPNDRGRRNASLIAETLTDVQNIIRDFAQTTSLRSKS